MTKPKARDYRRTRGPLKPPKKKGGGGKRPSDELRMAVFERDWWRCRGCGAELRDPRTLNKRERKRLRKLGLVPTADHIIPRSKGGKNREENLQLMCYACNQEKADRIEPRADA